MEVSARATVMHETRQLAAAPEIRAEEDGTVTFDGVASVVEKPYVVRDVFGDFTETFAKGAFAKTIRESRRAAEQNVALLVNHDGVPLAATRSGTLSLSAEPDLRAVAELDPASPLVQTVRSAMDRGDMDRMSIGFQAVRQEWNADYTERRIKEAKLFDVSVVTFPANPLTSASLRSLDDAVRALVADDLDPDEVRRTIAYLETLIAEPAAQRADDGDDGAGDDTPPAIHPDMVAAMVELARKARPAESPVL